MELKLENLEKIDSIIERLDNIESKIPALDKWLTTEEAAQYTTYSKDSIDNAVKTGDLILNKHYFQRNRKRVFSRKALDRWLKGEDIVNINTNQQINNTISNIVTEITRQKD